MVMNKSGDVGFGNHVPIELDALTKVYHVWRCAQANLQAFCLKDGCHDM